MSAPLAQLVERWSIEPKPVVRANVGGLYFQVGGKLNGKYFLVDFFIWDNFRKLSGYVRHTFPLGVVCIKINDPDSQISSFEIRVGHLG